MWQLWRWTFARLYVRSKRKWGEADAPLWSALLAVSALMFANLFAVACVVTWVLGFWLGDPRYKVHVIALMALLLLMNYWRLCASMTLTRSLKSLNARAGARHGVRKGNFCTSP